MKGAGSSNNGGDTEASIVVEEGAVGRAGGAAVAGALGEGFSSDRRELSDATASVRRQQFSKFLSKMRAGLLTLCHLWVLVAGC